MSFATRASCNRRATPTWRVFILIAFVSIGANSVARAQISPGPLAKPHAELEGTTRCLECHSRGEGSMDRLCRDCHGEIDWLVARKRGLHGNLRKDCAACHPDHVGVEFDLLPWTDGPPRDFVHDDVGWPLRGKHSSLTCESCHRSDMRRGPVATMLRSRADRKTWLGLETDCLSCHVDRHRGALDTDCSTCHNLKSWTPASRFDHGRSGYPLTGRHLDVTCEKCHLVPGRVSSVDDDGKEVPLYRPVAHEQCSDCHKDIHNGRLGPSCDTCHVTDDFASMDERRFDHSRTRYPLVGRHVSVACAKCHERGDVREPTPRFDECRSCHTDAHAGSATRAGLAVDCSSCHDERSFESSTFTVRDHEATAYPLAGAHSKVLCKKCHSKNPAGVASADLGSSGVWLRPPHLRCRDCHSDAHAGQFQDRSTGDECESCHRVDGWKPSLFTVEQHAELRLALDGAHADVECRACHSSSRTGLPALPDSTVLGSAGLALTLLEPTCGSCHFDPHDGRFDVGGERVEVEGCVTCHDVDRFRPSTVDADAHRQFAYVLDGAHRSTPCAFCHKELEQPAPEIDLLNVQGSPRVLRFESPHDTCSRCHASSHEGEFSARNRDATCDHCHVHESFRPAALFDHDRDSAYVLDGAHRNIPCAKCHPSATDADGRERVHYFPIPQRCADCHRGAKTYGDDELPLPRPPGGRP